MSRDKKFTVLLFSIIFLVCILGVAIAVPMIRSGNYPISGVLALILFLVACLVAGYTVYRIYKSPTILF